MLCTEGEYKGYNIIRVGSWSYRYNCTHILVLWIACWWVTWLLKNKYCSFQVHGVSLA